MNLYKDHSGRELIVVLDNASKLTYEAQLNLLKEINKRGLVLDTKILEEEIAQKETAIKNFEYLYDLGFQVTVDSSSQGLTVLRTGHAKLMDVVSTLIGFVLSLLGLLGFWLLMAIFFGNNEFALGKLIGYGLLIVVGGIGFKMLSGINRFLDYQNFSLVQQGSSIVLKHQGNTNTYTTADMSLQEVEEDLILMLGDEEIIYASAQNLKQKLTLQELVHKIKSIG
ncbi:hypothetical protein EAX61_04910 [Dokdonia sinensis]|uniref:Uncharacterized protein n=1 Tax=Dokdonia sinensis TaxID=2479847 RepID=A0A3M0GEJ9_9FLAO|nr:hypothetical protein [Dokdonia sinensis]RMB62917.1 hypothetical protein EAX61_04910 [Dokdonia sinensis]